MLFTYDAVGNLSTKTDPLGNATTFTYDAVNRLSKKEYEDDSYVAYQYDANGNMTEALDGTITFEFTYDAENKVTKVRDDTQGLEIEYAYDDNGNLLWIEDTSNSKINYYYDALNRVTDITNGSTFATIQYASCCSIRAKLTLGNGCYTEYEYDDAKRLTKITNKKSNGTVISSWDYAYDDVGNVTSQTDKDSLATSYTYDDIYRLTHVDYPSGSDYGYEYDAVGNRTKMYEYTASTITTTYTYDNADELTQYTTSTLTMSFGYASDGCLVSKSDGSDTWSYEWDYERRLNAFKKNSDSLVEYAYNPTGTRRYSSDSTLGLTNHFYSGNHVLADYSSNWTLTKSYILGPRVDEIIAMIDRTTDPNNSYYIAKDGLASSRELMNAGQSTNTRYDYDVWGSPSETKTSGNVSIDFRFNGTYYASPAQLCCHGELVYDPEIGRFLQDPLAVGHPESLINKVQKLEDIDPLYSYWWWECTLTDHKDDAARCCETNYSFCRANCGVLEITWSGGIVRKLAEYVGPAVGPGTVGSPSNVSRCFESCQTKYKTCTYWVDSLRNYYHSNRNWSYDGYYTHYWCTGHNDYEYSKNNWMGNGSSYPFACYNYYNTDVLRSYSDPEFKARQKDFELQRYFLKSNHPDMCWCGPKPDHYRNIRDICDHRGKDWFFPL